ncbi:hypothetical protein WA1_02825 [Scytonema hofmannii PCC 7110]|uniref:Uncharacterized protein n=1 Tax=Scytonema hofmannii PCC 7110 TaxID=128403 RepID=A0A139XHC3_9CYAN|nr:hypothetical protein [Scytonema hofmannii]KYC44090.1 hypothetical protein WA1_02825 [Scytonema hofmannii PCC 7110]
MENQNQLKEERNQLPQLDYIDFLSKIDEKLDGESGGKIFSLKKDFNNERLRLIVDIHSLASQIAKAKEIRLPLSKDEKAYRATINMSDACREVFKDKIKEIKATLSNLLTSEIKKILGLDFNIKNADDIIERFIESILMPLAKQPQESSLFTWNFPQSSGLSSQELVLESEFDNPAIRNHKVTIQINSATRFREFVLTALESYVRLKMNDESDLSDYVVRNVRTNLESLKIHGSQELLLLEKLINQETIGRLKRETEIFFLDFWSELIDEECNDLTKNKEIIYECGQRGKIRQISIHEASFYLKDYSRRIRLLENFINDPKKPDDYYDLTYQGVTVNIKELFSRRDAFFELPIVGQINGCIGQTDDLHRSITSITFGLKFKFNGRVNNPVKSPTSFAYGLEIINPNSNLNNEQIDETTPEERAWQVEKIIKYFILYYFAFACPNPWEVNYLYTDVLKFDIVQHFTNKVLPTFSNLDSQNDAEKKNLLVEFVSNINQYLVPQKLEAIAKLLKKYIKKTFVFDEKRVSIGISKKILVPELTEISDTDRFFVEELSSGNLKQCLKHIFISRQGVTKDAIIQLPVTLKFETDNFYRAAKKYEFDMAYQTDNIQMLPVFYKFVQHTESKQFERDKKNIQLLANLLNKSPNILKEVNTLKKADEASDLLSRVVFSGSVIEFQIGEVPLEKATYEGRFKYEITLKTLGFLILELITSRVKQNKNLFVGQWILHETSEEKTTQQEALIRQMVKEWNHLLSDFMFINSQGIVLPEIARFKILNAKKSLYSLLPQKYRSNNNDKRILKKLLLVMVSSNKCDARSSRWEENYIANLTGEIVAVEDTETGIKINRVKTLAGNYWLDELHSTPWVLRDVINVMYDKGFKDVLYIAKTPFSEQLRVTNQQNELFFMSSNLIKFLKDIADDLIIYPVLYDSYSALSIDDKTQEETLYIQDVRQLSNLFNDPNRSQVIFFNLLTVNTIEKARTFYNTATTYSTLLNAHPGDALDMTKVMNGLIKECQLKNDIMLYLTLFHYSRYEKKQSKLEKLLPKLDPLNDIIGDNAIGRLSARGKHCIPGLQMNYLAWLTEVNNALIDSTYVKHTMNDSANLSQTLLVFLEEIENFLAQHQLKDPLTELPRDYNDFLVRYYNNPILKEQICLILEKQHWFIENGNVEISF